MVWVTSKADASSMDQNGPLEVPLQVKQVKQVTILYDVGHPVVYLPMGRVEGGGCYTHF